MSVALVTGVTGFIGRTLAVRLRAEGWAVHALLRGTSDEREVPQGMSVHRHDGTVAGLTAIMADVRPDVVLHLASLYLASHLPDQVDDLIASNILFPAQLAEAMTGAGLTRLVNTGTAWQHFDGDGYNPVNLYAATKQACVDLLRYYHEAHGLSVVTLELFDTYGVGDKRRKLVKVLVDAAVSGEPIGLSPGDQVIDLTHADDVAQAFIVAAARSMAADHALDERFLVSGERMSVRALAALVNDWAGGRLQAEFGARPYRMREVMMPVMADGETVLPGWTAARAVRDTFAALASGR